MNVPFVIYADTESLLEKINTFYNNPEKSSTTKNKRIACRYSLFIHFSLDSTKNNYYIITIENIWKTFVKI